MAFSVLAKFMAGITVVGGLVATSTILLKDSFSKKVVPDTNIGQYYLANGFDGCKPLLDNQTRSKNNQEIYACPTGKDNKLNMVYYEEKSGRGKVVSKVNELKQHFASSSTQQLKVMLEDSREEKTLNWPNLLFNYTDPNSAGRDKGNAILKPSEECEFASVGDELFKCNDVWKVIKKR